MSSREWQIKEVMRCARDPVYFMRTYVKIQHPVKGTIPFETFPFQDDCVKAFDEHRLNIVLKSRQMGLSTVSAAYAVHMALFHQNKNVLVIATKLPTANNFVKKVKFMLDSLPKWLLISSYEPNSTEVKFKNGSTIKAIPTSEDAGSSEALSLLIVDEAAFIRDFNSIWTGLWPTLSTGGRAILLSTPCGIGGQFYRLWEEAEAQSNSFNAIKLMWNVHPEHTQEWYDEQVKNMSPKEIAQELECSFLGSGDTFLQRAEMDYLKSLLIESRRSDIDKHLRVWADPVPGHRYVISADVARGDSNDYSASHVIDVETLEVVAEWMGKVPPDRFADVLASIGYRYNDGMICPEINSFGWSTCAKLRDIGYPRLYYEKARGDVYNYRSSNPDAVPGFTTSVTSRVNILSRLEEAIRNKRLRPHSQRLLDQFQGFVWHGSKAVALKDCNDDLVMALAIGIWLIDSEICPVQKSTEMSIALLKGITVQKDTRHGSKIRDVTGMRAPGTDRFMNDRQAPGRFGIDMRWLFR